MKSVVLNGVVIKIGDSIRFVNDLDLYKNMDQSVNLPEIGKIYTVRSFSVSGGFLLEEVKNDNLFFIDSNGLDISTEPGFAIWRFDVANPLVLEVKFISKMKKKVNIKISPEVIERLEEILEYTN